MFATSDAAADAWTAKTLEAVDLHIMGAVTFGDMAAWWPFATDDFAKVMNDVPKAVFTRKAAASLAGRRTTQGLKDAAKMLEAEGGAQRVEADPEALKSWTEACVAEGPILDEIRRLKAQPGRDIMAHGGASFARSLIATREVDEYGLLVHPVALGQGKPIFTGLPTPLNLKLAENQAFPSGAVGLTYRPA